MVKLNLTEVSVNKTHFQNNFVNEKQILLVYFEL